MRNDIEGNTHVIRSIGKIESKVKSSICKAFKVLTASIVIMP